MDEDIKQKAKQAKKAKHRRPLWVRVLKWTGISAGIIVVLLALAVSLVVWILTPPKLTGLVNDTASHYLNADVKAQRIELTFWHTFPKLTLQMDSLTIVSRAFDKLTPEQRAALPAGADTLLTLNHFHGGMNLMPLLKDHIRLYDVVFDGMTVNMVQATDSVANYHILPETNDTSAIEVPKITLDRFQILNANRLQYRSVMDSMDLHATLKNFDLVGEDAPRYSLKFDGTARGPILEAFNFQEIIFGADGRIIWKHERPLAVKLEDFDIAVNDYHVEVNTDLDFTGTPVVNSLVAQFVNIPVEEALRHSPAALLPFVEPLKTDMRITTSVELVRPWSFADTLLPSLRGNIDIPPCAVQYQNLKFRRFTANLTTDFNGADINGSVFRLNRLEIDGESVKVKLNARINNVLSDPKVVGQFHGDVNLAQLPPKLKDAIPVQLTGRIKGNVDFRFALSDLSKEGFHRVHADGNFTMTKIAVIGQGIGEAYISQAVLDFGTNRAFQAPTGTEIDSLLQVNLAIDSLGLNALDMRLAINNFDANLGSVNRASSIDTAEINPFGGKITIEKLVFDAPADTTRIRLTNTMIGGALRRFQGGKRSPLMDLHLAMEKANARQGLNRVRLKEADMALTVHMNEKAIARRQRKAAQQAAADSLAHSQPSQLSEHSEISEHSEQADTLRLLDRKERRLLRNWDVSGHIIAKSGRLVTPYFPLRNTLSNVDLTFTADTIRLRDLGYKAGGSDFCVNGTIANLRRALTSRRNNTLSLDLSMTSDTVNVNELVHALFAGQTVAQMADTTAILADEEARDQDLQALADSAATWPLLIPVNLDARIRTSARHILYSDMQLHNFQGELLCYDGALNLRNLSASTEIGSVDLQALYSAPSIDSLQFGLGMRVNQFRLDRLTYLVPAIDSLMPMMRNFEGIVNADIAVTTDLSPQMDIEIPTLKAGMRIEGDSLVLLDAETFKSLSKWLFFKNKKRNMIDHMGVELIIENSTIELFPFLFDIDRYRLGVMGHSDLNMNLDYHVSVLKSPMPFKFGINIKGNPDKLKIKLGGAKFKDGMVGERQQIADTTRINLVRQLEGVFRRGVRNARRGRLNFLPSSRTGSPSALPDQTETPADSLFQELAQ